MKNIQTHYKYIEIMAVTGLHKKVHAMIKEYFDSKKLSDALRVLDLDFIANGLDNDGRASRYRDVDLTFHVSTVSQELEEIYVKPFNG